MGFLRSKLAAFTSTSRSLLGGMRVRRFCTDAHGMIRHGRRPAPGRADEYRRRRRRPPRRTRRSRLAGFLAGARRLFVLTGAGCSTESGIPDYRDADGGWKHRKPTTYQRFVGSESVRRRYWAGSLVGWERIAAARPNAAHRALAAARARGPRPLLLTPERRRAPPARRQPPRHRSPRPPRQGALPRLPDALPAPAVPGGPAGEQPGLPRPRDETARPDGDAEIEAERLARFAIPACLRCGGTLKPDVVFFGEAVPPRRVAEGMERLAEADAMLVVGSSLMVWSGYRFVVRARELGLPVAALNLGRTRADGELDLKIAAPCGETLAAATALLAP